MNNVSKFSFCILFLMVLVLFCGAVSAAEWNVSVGESIQSAVNSASENDIIIVNDDNGTSYTYNENVVINKKVSLQAASNLVTVQALNSSKPVITVNSLGSGSLIQDFILTGATNSSGIFLSGTSNCNVNGNNFTWNYHGVHLVNSNNNTIQNNTATNNQNGIGVYIFNSSANVNFNRISGNSAYGLYNTGNGTVNATNNWWGSNNPVVSLSSPSDICIQNGIVTYNPWLVLNVNATSNMISGSESIITADLTHNNADEDTSSSGHIPDGLPVNFTTSLGTITTPTYTWNGKASAVLKLNETTKSATINTTATFDNQSVSTQITKQAAQAVLNITADNVFVLPYPCRTDLNISYRINLTDPVTWVSVVYRHVDEPGIGEVDIIVNGETVFTKWFVNYYFFWVDDEEWWCNYSDPAIWGMELNPDLFMYYARRLNFAEQSGQDMGPIYQEMGTYLTNIDSYMAYYHRDSFCDNIQTTLTYPGGSLSKTETITYINDPDAGFEIIQSFAITTGKVTDDMVQYWLNQNSTYPVGHMKAIYGTFMTALTTSWLSDKLADEMVSYLNVTWARSAPTLVTCGVSGGKAYVNCPDPAMGMSIEGNTTNVKSFRFACSFMLSEMENMALSATGLNVTSSTCDLGLAILNGDIADIIDNGTEIIVKLTNGDIIRIIIDPETGLVKDMLGDYKGAESTDSAYCYHNDRTDTLGHQINEFLSGLTDEQEIALSIGIAIGMGVLMEVNPYLGLSIILGCSYLAAKEVGLIEDPLNPYKWARFGLIVVPSLIPWVGLEKAAGQIMLKYTLSREVTEIIVPYMEDGVIFSCRYIQEVNLFAISVEVIEDGALTTIRKVVFGSTPKEAITKMLTDQVEWGSLSGVVNIVDPENNSYNSTYYDVIGQYIETI